MFKVIDNETGLEVELPTTWGNGIANENWCKHLEWCDIDGWYISDSGSLILVDEIGQIACPPDNRFKVDFNVLKRI